MLINDIKKIMFVGIYEIEWSIYYSSPKYTKKFTF
jgi:hypothetical protein